MCFSFSSFISVLKLSIGEEGGEDEEEEEEEKKELALCVLGLHCRGWEGGREEGRESSVVY